MFGAAVIHEAKRIARCVDAIQGESDQQRFILGTSTPSTRKSNQLQLLDSNLSVIRTYAHANPIDHFAMCPHPQRTHNILTTFVSERNEPTIAVWNIGNVEGAPSTGDVSQLDLQAQVTMDSPIVKSIWNPTEESSAIASLNSTHVATWAFAEGAIKEVTKLSFGDGKLATSLAWDPHHRQQISATVDESLYTWDVRSGKIAYKIEQAHFQCTRDVDYNPNKPYYVVSGGDDGKVKFWDIRKPKHALLTLKDHSHWVWCVKYNRFHDQLVLSSSSDSLVNLWRVSSISSAPLMEMDDADSEHGVDVGDAKIKSYEEHEDSVYSVAWGSVDSWVFVSVSYDGRVVLNQVPSTEKYRILL